MLRAAWGHVTSQMTGSDDVVFGATVSGRNAPVAGIESMAFATIATVPLRLKLNKDQRIVEYLNQVQRQATEMIPYEQTGLQRITQLVSPDARQACTFQTLLVVQPRARTESTKASQLGEWTTPDQAEWFTTYSLTIEATVSPSQIDIDARFDSRVIESWSSAYSRGWTLSYSSLAKQDLMPAFQTLES